KHQKNLHTFTIGTCTLHNINVASPEYPVTSTISLSIRSNTGNPFQLDLPARADRAGRWSFPDLTEIVQRIEEIGKSSAGSSSGSGETSSGSRVTPSTQQRETRGATGMPADRTAVIRWPESGRTPVQPNVANAPPPAQEDCSRHHNPNRPKQKVLPQIGLLSFSGRTVVNPRRRRGVL